MKSNQGAIKNRSRKEITKPKVLSADSVSCTDHDVKQPRNKRETTVKKPFIAAAAEKKPRVRVAIAILLIAITTAFTGWSWNHVQEWVSKSGKTDIQEILLESPSVPLHEPFRFDFDTALKLRQQNMKRYDYQYLDEGIDKRSDLSLDEFREVYDGMWPVIITDVVPKWQAFNWTREMFCETYSKEIITMKGVNGHLSNGQMMALPFEIFCENTQKAFPRQWTYLLDELFIPMRPLLHNDIGDCIYCKEDFFELFPEEVRPWNAMLLWGTMFSRSALHIDPYNWTGTNAVIFGRKHWKLYPPGQDHLLYVKPGVESGFPLNCYKYNSEADGFDLDVKRYGLVAEAKVLEFEQLPGEILFIPTGWFHQAYNVDETLAVSGQMANTNNYRIILEEIIKIGNVARNNLPSQVSTLSPAEQVKEVMSQLSKEILERGRLTTQAVIAQVQGTGTK